LNEFLIINTKEKNKKLKLLENFVVKGYLQFRLVLAKEPFEHV